MARPAALTPMRADVARRMRRTAAQLDADHPETVAGGHVRDAARVLEHGSDDGAKRHLDAAMEVLTPRNLYRHGITDDEGHATAKLHLHEVNRHRLAVQDIEDAAARNDHIRERAAARQAAPSGGAPDGAAPSIGAQLSNVVELKAQSWMAERRDLNGRWSGGVVGPSFGARGVEVGNRKSRLDRGSASMQQVLFGKHVSKKEGGDLAAMFGHVKAAPSPKKERAALTKPQRKVYDKLRNRGRTHAHAYIIASKFSPEAIKATLMAGPVGQATELVGPKGYEHGWIKVSDAGGYHGRRVHGKITPARPLGYVTGVYNSLNQTITPRHSRPVRVSHVTADDKALPAPVQRKGMIARLMPAASFAGDHGNLVVTLSARTAALERTPAPRGKPGGPGLYDVKGMGHTAYYQQVVKALIEKRGMPPGKAYAIARAALRKWMRGGGHVHPEVRAAAAKAEAGEVARQARAHTSHATAAWEVADTLIELAVT